MKQDSDQILWLIAESIRRHVASDGLIVIGAKFVQRVTEPVAHVDEPVLAAAGD